jgi:Tfp pilus assembly protein PilF
VRRAIELFQEAIARDPGYGRAYQGLAEAFAVVFSYTGAKADPFIEMSLAALDEADALGGTDSHADAVRGFIHLHKLEWESARARFQAALAGEPGNSDLLQWHSQFLAGLGYVDRALLVTQRSVEADPLSPVAHQRLGIVFLWHDNLEGAEEQFRIATEELGLGQAANARALFPLLLRPGRYAEARAFAEAFLTMGGEPIAWLDPWIAHLQGDGPAAAAVTALTEAYENGLDSRLYVGALYFVDDADAQFEAIDQVLSAGRPLDHEVWFVQEGRVLQGDPRFPALLERLAIIDYWEAHGWPEGCRRVGDLIRCERPSESAAQVTAGDPPVS